MTFAYDPDAEANAANLDTLSFVSDDGSDDADDPDTERDFKVEQTVNVTAAGAQGTLGEPKWQRIPRERVEQIIGQPFAPVEAAGGQQPS